MRITRPISALVLAVVLAGSAVACDERDELRDIDRGTDARPGTKGTPPEEGQ